MGFSKQEHWSGLPFPPPGGIPNPGIEPWSPVMQADSLPAELEGKPLHKAYYKARRPELKTEDSLKQISKTYRETSSTQLSEPVIMYLGRKRAEKKCVQKCGEKEEFPLESRCWSYYNLGRLKLKTLYIFFLNDSEIMFLKIWV